VKFYQDSADVFMGSLAQCKMSNINNNFRITSEDITAICIGIGIALTICGALAFILSGAF